MKTKVIYVLFARSSFVEVDIAILSKRYELLLNLYPWRKKWMTPFLMIRQIGFLLANVRSTKSIIISSGGYWSLVPALFGKLFSIPVFIILNGSDCASLPFVNYGNLRSFLLRQVCRISFHYASMLLPVSQSLVKTKNTYYSRDNSFFQGYLHFFPQISTKYHVIFNGLDEQFWDKDPSVAKEPHSFISVFSPSQFMLKGGDLILSMGRRFPHCQFYMAGIKEPPAGTLATPNVHFLGRLDSGELRHYYSLCQYHFQLSIFEGFGCTLAEAMLCRCIPIGSDVNMIPEIIGDTGFILPHRDPDLLEDLISKVLENSNQEQLGGEARKRIIENFSIAAREQQLLALLG